MRTLLLCLLAVVIFLSGCTNLIDSSNPVNFKQKPIYSCDRDNNASCNQLIRQLRANCNDTIIKENFSGLDIYTMELTKNSDYCHIEYRVEKTRYKDFKDKSMSCDVPMSDIANLVEFPTRHNYNLLNYCEGSFKDTTLILIGAVVQAYN